MHFSCRIKSTKTIQKGSIHMSQSHFTKILLDLKDKNITIEEMTEKQKDKGHLTNFIYAKLTYTPTHCSCCGVLNQQFDVVKNGFKVSKIKWLPMAHFPTTLVLKKQRFLCRHCHQTFIAETPEVDKHCFIANRVKQSIAVEANLKISMTDLAKRHFVSTQTVDRVWRLFDDSFKPSFQSLPTSLCFDEFKSVKRVEGAMSFIYMNAQTREIIDVLPDRRLSALRDHFQRYSHEARKQVKQVVIDMNAPYFVLIEELFPEAKIIIDPFHFIQLINRSMNQTRIRIMKKFNNSKTYKQTDYTKLKRYWKLLLKDAETLDYEHYYYQKLFKKEMVATEIVDYLLTLDDELKATYLYYQHLLSAYRTSDYDEFKQLLYQYPGTLSFEMKRSIRTLKKHRERIRNTFSMKHTNGPLEGTINKIKVLKRIAFGYQSFTNFRRRILLCCRTIQTSSKSLVTSAA